MKYWTKKLTVEENEKLNKVKIKIIKDVDDVA